MTKVSNTGKLVISILICEAIGVISGWIGSAYNNPWFETLQKPSWNPPGAVFGPVWTTLYLFMGIALWLVWKSDAVQQRKTAAEVMFALQLFFNFWWSIIFFKFQSPGIAFIDICLMIITILITIFQFGKISNVAAWLLVPYISWVCFASVLNYTIWKMN